VPRKPKPETQSKGEDFKELARKLLKVRKDEIPPKPHRSTK
jgi:hypothetical protein